MQTIRATLKTVLNTLEAVAWNLNGLFQVLSVGLFVALRVSGVGFWPALGIAVAVAYVPARAYERACNAAGRRLVSLPFGPSRHTSRMLGDPEVGFYRPRVTSEELDALRAHNDTLRERNATAAAELSRQEARNRGLRDLVLGFRAGSVVDYEYVANAVLVDSYTYDGDTIVVDLHLSGSSFVDVYDTGDRVRTLLGDPSELTGPAGAPATRPQVRGLRFAANADCALALDSMRAEPGTLSIRYRPEQVPVLEIITADMVVLSTS